MSKKNIVILTASHPYKAAGLVAYDLMQVLKQENYNVTIVTNSRLEKNYSDTISLLRNSKNSILLKAINIYKILYNKFVKIHLQKINPDYHMYGLFQRKSKDLTSKIISKIPFNIDAFIYLFPQNFLDVEDLSKLHSKTGAPVFWYMMDMAPMTGGCHYAWDCTGFTDSCGTCPGIYSNDVNDITHQLWSKKKQNLQSSNIIPVAASTWQFKQLEKSSIFFKKNHYKILIPIDPMMFRPGKSEIARKKLLLPIDKKIIFFGAMSVFEKRKGFKQLVDALHILKEQLGDKSSEVLLAIAGHGNQNMADKLPFDHKFLGYLNYSDLALVYQSADLFACPSVEDSGPMMINQAIMSGTPVVSFEMGIALDLVINGLTGFRVENKNSKEFAKALQKLLEMSSEESKIMRKNIEKLISEKSSFSMIGKQWSQILKKEINA